MTNIFKTLQDRLATAVLFVWPLSLLLFAVSCILSREDYMTSLEGYKLIPTAKWDSVWTPYAVAFIPQAGTIVAWYIFSRNTRTTWAFWTAFFLFLADISTDIMFKIHGEFTIARFIFALAESVIIFTIGSELLMTASFGIIIELYPEFMEAIGTLKVAVVEGVASFLNFESNRRDDRKDNRYQNNNQIQGDRR